MTHGAHPAVLAFIAAGPPIGQVAALSNSPKPAAEPTSPSARRATSALWACGTAFFQRTLSPQTAGQHDLCHLSQFDLSKRRW